MFITTVMPISTLLKIAFVFIIAIIIIRYVDKLRKTSFRYNIFDVHKKNEDAKVYNINCDDDVIRYENGDIYKGQIKNGIRDGLGTCYFANKDVYEGMWKNDKMECVGKYKFADKSFYSGDFKNGCKEGIGIFTCDDYKYIGQYYADRNGRVGTFHLPDNAYMKVIIEN